MKDLAEFALKRSALSYYRPKEKGEKLETYLADREMSDQWLEQHKDEPFVRDVIKKVKKAPKFMQLLKRGSMEDRRRVRKYLMK